MCRVFQEGYDDPHKPLPSPVVHIRGLVDGVMEADLVEALQEFGVVRSETTVELGLHHTHCLLNDSFVFTSSLK